MNWNEKYRPKTLGEVVGQDDVVNALKQMKELNTNLLFSGPPGVGKTTIALILAKKFNLPMYETNASDDRGIDIIRNEIKTQSRMGKKRIIFLDEAENLTLDAQGALRRIMEKTHSIFILSGNNCWKIIDPIVSRCATYEFKPLEIGIVLGRLVEICNAEGITIEENAQDGLVELLEQSGGDMRKAINILTKVINTDKKITLATIKSFIKPKIAKESLKMALEGDFIKAQRLMEDAYSESRMSPIYIIKELYESIKEVPNEEHRIKLFRELAITERACKTQADPVSPLIQLIGFISSAYLIPHLSTKCPVLTGEYND